MRIASAAVLALLVACGGSEERLRPPDGYYDCVFGSRAGTCTLRFTEDGHIEGGVAIDPQNTAGISTGTYENGHFRIQFSSASVGDVRVENGTISQPVQPLGVAAEPIGPVLEGELQEGPWTGTFRARPHR